MSHPLVGETVGPYRIDALIGRGGMGEVFRAHDERLQRRVAIKVLKHRGTDDPAARRRFLREARIAGRISHSFVASVFDVVEKDDDLYLVMEYLDGKSLADALREGPLSADAVTHHALEMAEALGAIHKHGLVHRDLKPGNVILTGDGHLKVTDFGIALELPPRTAPTTSSSAPTLPVGPDEFAHAGTLLYMSPEQVRGGRVDERSDLFALGSVMWEMLSGEQPFRRATPEAISHAIEHDPPSAGREPPTISASPQLRQVIHRLLAKEPERRYQKAEHVAADLHAIARGDSIAPFPEEVVRRSRRVVVTLAVISALAVAALGWQWWSSKPTGRAVVAVLPFADRTGAGDGTRGEMLADLLAARISESTTLRAPDTERMRDVLAGLDSALGSEEARSTVARATGARWSVSGSLWRESDLYHAVVETRRKGGGDVISSFRISAASTAALADLAAIRLLGVLAPGPPAAAAMSAAAPESVSDAARELEFRARAARARFDYAEGIRLLEQALAESPGFLRARLELADLLYESGDGVGARSEADLVRAALGDRGRVATQEERWGLEAVDARIREDSAREVEARTALADARPDDPARLAALAAAYSDAARFDEALVTVRRAEGFDAGDGRLKLQRGRALRDLKRYSEAGGAIDEAEETFAPLQSPIAAARVAMERGRLHYDGGRYAEAARAFQAAVESFRAGGLPAWAATAEKNVAGQEGMQGQFGSAETRLRRVLPTLRTMGHPGLVIDGLNDLGSMLFAAGRFDEAERLLREALALSREVTRPEFRYPVQTGLASLLNATGRVGEGSALAEEALASAREAKRDDGQEAALLLLADADYQLGQLGDAAKSYAEAIVLLQPRRATSERYALARLGEVDVLRAQSRLGSALAAIDDGLATTVPSRDRTVRGYCIAERGRLLGELGAFQEARRDLDAAAAIAAGNSAADGVLRDVVHRVDLFRAVVSSLEHPDARATDALEAAARDSAAMGVVGGEATALAHACAARTAAGRKDGAAAVALGRRALAALRSSAAERLMARARLADALAEAGEAKEAEAEARRTLDEAESIGMPLPAAIAAGVLATLPHRPADSDTLVARGRTALERVLAGVPDDRRTAFAARWDIRRVESQLAAAR